jgi:transcriptional regulator with XRE-family HTH domain
MVQTVFFHSLFRVENFLFSVGRTWGIQLILKKTECGHAVGYPHRRAGAVPNRPKIRTLRLKKKLGLVQLGEHTGLSPAMLSKIERGQLFPTLPTLLRIAMVFGVGLEHFFVETAERPTIAVVRKKDRLRLPDRAGEAIPSYFFESLDFPVTDRKLQAFYAEFPTRSQASEPHQHAGAELIYVLKGQACCRDCWR